MSPREQALETAARSLLDLIEKRAVFHSSECDRLVAEASKITNDALLMKTGPAMSPDDLNVLLSNKIASYARLQPQQAQVLAALYIYGGTASVRNIATKVDTHAGRPYDVVRVMLSKIRVSPFAKWLRPTLRYADPALSDEGMSEIAAVARGQLPRVAEADIAYWQEFYRSVVAGQPAQVGVQ